MKSCLSDLINNVHGRPKVWTLKAGREGAAGHGCFVYILILCLCFETLDNLT